MNKAKTATKPKRRRNKKKTRERVLGALFVLLILLALAVAVDYILFHFGMPPLFAIETAGEDCTEHIGLLYLVSDYSDREPERALEWDWIWQKFRITRVD